MERIRIVFIVVLAVLVMGIACSSGEKEETVAAGNSNEDALAYYQKIDGMIIEIMNKVNGFNRVWRTRNKIKILGDLREVQGCLSDNADKASELGGYQGESDLNWAVLDLLEFYESLYKDNMPQMIEIGFEGDDVHFEELNQAYKMRLKEELPPLEKKYLKAEKAFAVKYHLKSSGGNNTKNKIDRHLNFQEKHGSQRDKDRAKRIKEQLKELQKK